MDNNVGFFVQRAFFMRVIEHIKQRILYKSHRKLIREIVSTGKLDTRIHIVDFTLQQVERDVLLGNYRQALHLLSVLALFEKKKL